MIPRATLDAAARVAAYAAQRRLDLDPGRPALDVTAPKVESDAPGAGEALLHGEG